MKKRISTFVSAVLLVSVLFGMSAFGTNVSVAELGGFICQGGSLEYDDYENAIRFNMNSSGASFSFSLPSYASGNRANALSMVLSNASSCDRAHAYRIFSDLTV